MSLRSEPFIMGMYLMLDEWSGPWSGTALQPLILVYNACSGLPVQILGIDRVVVLVITGLINVKKIAFGNKEHTTDKKMGVSVLLRHFVSSNEVCNTAYAF